MKLNNNQDIKVVPKLKQFSITDKEIIKKANMTFKEGLNIIIGKNGSGKTTVIKEIEKTASHIRTFDDLMNISAVGEKIMFFYLGLIKTPFNACFLIDNGDLDRLDRQKFEKTIKALSETENQIIITLNSVVKIPKIKANIIDTASFELKQ